MIHPIGVCNVNITPSEETITVSTTITTEHRFRLNDEVVFADEEAPRTPLTIIGLPDPERQVWADCYMVHNPHSLFRLGFAREEELKPAFFVTVEDRFALDALPIGTKYRDVEGDVIHKHSDGEWYLVEGRGFPWGVGLLEEFLPGVLLNPEILGF